jgi:hypothetical protein
MEFTTSSMPRSSPIRACQVVAGVLPDVRRYGSRVLGLSDFDDAAHLTRPRAEKSAGSFKQLGTFVQSRAALARDNAARRTRNVRRTQPTYKGAIDELRHE